MFAHDDSRLFRLHFKGAGTEGHMLPADLLVRAMLFPSQTDTADQYSMARRQRGASRN